MSQEFQFHKGTIRTKRDEPIAYIIGNFNSIKVRLELEKGCSFETLEKHFNSIKVRLEQLVDRSNKEIIANFNSIKVRLEPSGAGTG